MNNLFIVKETSQGYDYDCWSHWVEYTPVSYHLSREGAEAKIQELLSAKIMQIPELIRLNPTTPQSRWVELDKNLSNNVHQLSQTNNGGDEEDEPIYVIHTALLAE